MYSMMRNTDPAGIVTAAPGSPACVSKASIKNDPGTSLARLMVWYEAMAEIGSPFVPGASSLSRRYAALTADVSWWRNSTALALGAADAWFELALSNVPSYARTT